ncbi:hypothetical protein LBBP_00775 [Leptospira borgpetersenii serovar Ballum]|uniref:Uncharacterized protein n=1 Tax=Leptospira borgpetersenii serovar Ballum TaxID=280505 RepID=A0A0S2IN61_LEPBO|nr:hypothetical protein LBBP_00775 [Leptospira borgpetersenii serovar Ballum]
MFPKKTPHGKSLDKTLKKRISNSSEEFDFTDSFKAFLFYFKEC